MKNPKDLTVNESDSVRLLCRIQLQSDLPHLAVQWMRSGEVVKGPDSVLRADYDYSVALAHRNDSGRYQCVVISTLSTTDAGITNDKIIDSSTSTVLHVNCMSHVTDLTLDFTYILVYRWSASEDRVVAVSCPRQWGDYRSPRN